MPARPRLLPTSDARQRKSTAGSPWLSTPTSSKCPAGRSPRCCSRAERKPWDADSSHPTAPGLERLRQRRRSSTLLPRWRGCRCLAEAGPSRRIRQTRDCAWRRAPMQSPGSARERIRPALADRRVSGVAAHDGFRVLTGVGADERLATLGRVPSLVSLVTERATAATARRSSRATVGAEPEWRRT